MQHAAAAAAAAAASQPGALGSVAPCRGRTAGTQNPSDDGFWNRAARDPQQQGMLICNGHGVCGTYVPHHYPPIVVWTHSNDCVAIHTHVGYAMGRYTS